MSRVLLVERASGKLFRITVSDEAKLTFGPWSPPGKDRNYDGAKALEGTLRVYENATPKASILAVFSGVKSYRWSGLEYEEQLFVEKGSTVWESDQNGYKREEALHRSSQWTDPQLESGKVVEEKE